MASCQTARWVSTAPYVVLTVTQTESTDTAVTLSWTLQYKSDYAANTNGAGRAYTVKIGGSVVKEGTYNIDGVTGTKTIASGTKTINKSTAAQSIAFSVSFNFSLTWSGTYGGTKSASGSISVAAKTSYTIEYNANGGSGAPAKQTKWHGTTLTLSSTNPTRTGYAFQGWATSASGSVTYSAGASYTANSSVTLYAIWTANTYKVSYNANGGSGAPSAQTKTYGKALTLSSSKPTRTNYTFKGWGTSASATTATYAAGASYTANAAITLYAVWELAYEKPRIVLNVIGRCTSDGTASDTGTYASVNFNWACDKTVSSVKIEWKLASTTTYSNSKTISATGTSGKVSTVIGDGALSVEKTYVIRITVTDGGGSFARTYPINGIKFAFDTLPGNEGVAFGKPAENKDYADFKYKVRLRDNLLMQSGMALYSRNAEDTASVSLLYLNASNNTVLGYGGYANQIGVTNIYGNSVNFTSRNGVSIDGCQIAANKVLWSGGWHMNETQTATLSEAISKQANGIVLVWCEYNNTDKAIVNANFNTCFIPKHFVGAHAGRGVGALITSATLNVMCSKYLYISDTSILGYSSNNEEVTEKGCGVKSTPRNFVLRYVIGV